MKQPARKFGQLPKWLCELMIEIEILPGTVEFSIERSPEDIKDDELGLGAFREIVIKVKGRVIAKD